MAGSSGDTADADVELLRRFAESIRKRQETMLGFPVNLDFDFHLLADFLSLHLNNAGNPGQASEYGIDSKPFEQAVVDFFADLAGGVPTHAVGDDEEAGADVQRDGAVDHVVTVAGVQAVRPFAAVEVVREPQPAQEAPAKVHYIE